MTLAVKRNETMMSIQREQSNKVITDAHEDMDSAEMKKSHQSLEVL